MTLLLPRLMLNASIAYITDREEKESCPMFGEDDIQGKKHALVTELPI